MSDNVNSPKHYNADPSGVECIQITRHRNFNVGNAIKYLWRAGLKGFDSLQVTLWGSGGGGAGSQPAPMLPAGDQSMRTKEIEDLKKAAWYIIDEIERLGGVFDVKDKHAGHSRE